MSLFRRKRDHSKEEIANWAMIDFEAPHWELSSPKDFPSFLLGLPIVFNEADTLYLENGTPPKELMSFFEDRCLTGKPKIPHGTLWPRPKYFHLPIIEDNVKDLATLSDQYAEPQVAVHVHIYRGNKMLLQWFDAFADPMFVSTDIREDQIQRFSEALGIKYKRIEKASNKSL
jgi:hypothetical protein